MDPVSLARKIIAAVPDFNQFLPKMPHAGSGFAWRMARKGGEARFDFRLYGNEIVACNLLLDLNSGTIQQLFSQLVLRYVQYSADSDGSKKESKQNPQ